jgi:nicotinic acid phosphoribosyltransferase
MKFLQKLKAIKAILFSDEYFVTIANQQNPYGNKNNGPVVYEYFSNTDSNMFYLFINHYIKKYINYVGD